MIETICHCKTCHSEASYFSRNKYTKEEAKKELDFICNSCFSKKENERKVVNDPRQKVLI